MPILSSRPSPSTQADPLIAAQPSINILHWLTSSMRLNGDDPLAVMVGANFIEEALECMMLEDYDVTPTLNTSSHLRYEVAIKPTAQDAIVFFVVQFQVV